MREIEYTQEDFEKDLKDQNTDIIAVGECTGLWNKVRVRHKCGYEWDTKPVYIVKFKRGCPVCNGVARKTNEKFVEECNAINIDVLSEYKTNRDPVRIRFRDCGHEHTAIPRDILSGKGCPYCASRKLLVGFNDISTVAPWMVQYFKDPEDGKKYMPNTKTYITCVCPNCHHEESKRIQSVYINGFHCSYCDDGMSYPNKFSRAMLGQLPIDNLEIEYSPDWANGKRYDNYFEFNGNKYILEMDGGFHYKDTNFSNSEDVKQNDDLKDRMAYDNGVIMIRINCYPSTREHIINNIQNSLLNELFDLNNVDWDICESAATKTVIKDICEYYQQHKTDSTFHQIAQHFHIADSTLQNYRKIGISAGWCVYTNEEKKMLDSAHMKNNRTKSIAVYDSNHNKIGDFESAKLGADYLTKHYNNVFNENTIRNHCVSQKIYRGFYFEYTRQYGRNASN